MSNSYNLLFLFLLISGCNSGHVCEECFGSIAIPYLVLAHGTVPIKSVKMVALTVRVMYSEARVSGGRAV
jgi:hypothetical protein